MIVDRRDVELRPAEAMKTIERLRTALEQCADWFSEQSKIHADKNEQRRAARYADRAAYCRAAIGEDLHRET